MITIIRAGVALVALLVALSISVDAQWVRYPTAGVLRTRDGKPASPRRRRGCQQPGLGVWNNDGYGAPGQKCWSGAADGLLEHGMSATPPSAVGRRTLREAKRRSGEGQPRRAVCRLAPADARASAAEKILHNPALLVILHERNMSSARSSSMAAACLTTHSRRGRLFNGPLGRRHARGGHG